MLQVQASKLDLLPKPLPPSSSTPAISSLLFEPHSSSLALMLADSSVLLYDSFSPFFSPPASAPTPIPPISSSACFLRLLPSPAAVAYGRVLFVSAAPHAAGAAFLLRAWILRRSPAPRFSPARLSFKQERAKDSIVLDLHHGFGVRLAGSVNVLAVHSVSANKIWVLAGRAADLDGVDVVLYKCAVIDCCLPIYSLEISLGFLLLGEVDGVRVFPLRPLIKGRKIEKEKGSGNRRMGGNQATDSHKKGLPNGLVVQAKTGVFSTASSKSSGEIRLESNIDDKARASERDEKDDGERSHCKLRTAKIRQNSGDLGSSFVFIRCRKDHNSESGIRSLTSLKAVLVHALNTKKILVLDSEGYLHLVNLHNSIMASETNAKFTVASKDAYVKRFDHNMKVQMLAVLPDVAARKQIIWISDGRHSLHMMSLGDEESNDDNDKETAFQMSAIQAIFTGEKIESIVPLSSNSVLILGQGNIFVYSVA